jgi:hypothetical protein
MTISPDLGGFGPLSTFSTGAKPKPAGSSAPAWLKPVAIGAGVAAGIGGLALALKASGPLRAVGGAMAAIAGIGLLSGCGTTSPSAAKGSTPDEVADSILKYYDHSGNGAVELKSRSGLPKDDERLRIQVRDRSDTKTDWDPNDEDFLPFGNPWGDSTTTRWSERRLVSGIEIFDAANGDGDDVITRDELLGLIRQYDDFGDGQLGKDELTAFRDGNPEQFDDWTRIG